MRILFIEDDQRLREIVRKSLETECYVVDVAEDGREGSRRAVGDTYDLVILDNLLPYKRGAEVCRDIRGQGKAVPIIMLSVESDVATKVELLEAGADDYVSKPFVFDELLARIRALLRRPARIDGAVMEAGGLSLDSSRHIVAFREREIYLSRKEFILLEYFMRNRGLVISRGMLLEHVWNKNTDPASNTFESHVMSLRKKLEPVTGMKLIHTIPGRGYRFDPRSRDYGRRPM